MIISVLGRYEIRPSTGGLDFSVYEYREIRKAPLSGSRKSPESNETGWVHTGKYAYDIPHAIEIIYEREIKRVSPDELQDLKSAIAQMRRIKTELINSIKQREAVG